MPEAALTSLENAPGFDITSAPIEHSSVEEEVELNAEDYARLDNLFERIAANGQVYGFADGEVLLLRRELRGEGSRATQYLLGKIAEIEASDVPSGTSFDQYRFIVSLDFCSTSAQSRQIGALLNSESVVHNSDRSSAECLLATLRRIGEATATPEIVCFAQEQARYFAPQGENQNIRANTKIATAILVLRAIARRTTNPEDQTQIHEACATLTELLEQHGGAITDIYSDTAEEDSYLETAFESEFGDPETPESDVECDEECLGAYDEGKMTAVAGRLESIRLLHQAKSHDMYAPMRQGLSLEELYARHSLEFKEQNPSPYTPTLGIEIELREHVILPPSARNWTLQQRTEYLNKIKEQLYNPTETFGIPAGHDAFYEFAHKPAKNYLTPLTRSSGSDRTRIDSTKQRATRTTFDSWWYHNEGRVWGRSIYIGSRIGGDWMGHVR